MKTPFLSLGAAALFLFASRPAVQAQELVTTGVVQEVITKTGVLTVLSDQTHRPMTFFGADKTSIFTVDGKPAQLLDLQTGTKVTLQYAERNQQWYVSKIMFGEARTAASAAAAAAASAPTGVVRSTTGGSATGAPDMRSRVEPLNTSGRPSN